MKIWAIAILFAVVSCAAPHAEVVGAHRSGQCVAVGLLADPACTPGAVETTDLSVICHQSTKERRNVSDATKRQVMAMYGAHREEPGDLEIDHYIPLALGGSNDVANLWPEPAPAFHRKDRLEDELHRRVCAGQLQLEGAQHDIATNWVVTYKREFGEDP